MTKIEWTERTWNPVVGCKIVSPGCTNCYAMRQAARIEKMNPTRDHAGYVNPYDGTTEKVNGNVVWTGRVALAERQLLAPLKRRKPTMYFVNSMGDLFHEDVPVDWIDRVFAVMALCPQHTFQVLTKRSARMREYASRTNDSWHGNAELFADRFNSAMDLNYAWIKDIDDMPWPLPNVWLGVSAEDQRRANERIPDLLATPAAVRFASVEPMLGPIDLEQIRTDTGYLDAVGKFIDRDACGLSDDPLAASLLQAGIESGHADAPLLPRLDWIICGGESGKGARPMHPDWARSLRDQCEAAGTAFFFKQWGEWTDGQNAGPNPRSIPAAEWFNSKWDYFDQPPSRPDDHFDDEPDVFRVGKARAGRLLDGREWNGMPRRLTETET